MATVMSTPYQNEERRFALRMALRLPIVVSGRSEDGAAWSEPTETDDISTSGALFHLNQKVSIGDNLYVRAHRPDWILFAEIEVGLGPVDVLIANGRIPIQAIIASIEADQALSTVGD